jgi:hypothetical protein
MKKPGTSRRTPAANETARIPAIRTTVDETLLADINRHVRVYGSGDDGVLLFGAQTNRMHSYGQWGTSGIGLERRRVCPASGITISGTTTSPSAAPAPNRGAAGSLRTLGAPSGVSSLVTGL